MSLTPVIHWFRRDLRLQDNTALHHAISSGAPVLPVFIFDDRLLKSDRVGAPRVAFMLHALQALDNAVRNHGGQLMIRRGQPSTILSELVKAYDVEAVYFNRDYSPYARKRDEAVASALTVPVHTFDDLLIMPPGSVLKADSTPYTVYTPYRKKWNAAHKTSPYETKFTADCFMSDSSLSSDELPTLAELGFQTEVEVPTATEQHAHERLLQFVEQDINTYDATRNRLPAEPFSEPPPQATSYLSPYLRMGLLSARTCYTAAREAYAATGSSSAHKAIETWVGELTWRDFYYQIMWEFPHVMQRDFVRTYDALPWRDAPADLQAWQDGMTGYPIVDAPMRQLKATGWMPNRARMIVASFLTKHLLIHWLPGDKYFMQNLLDGDAASNNGGWQWSAGTGTDAQPYFRIFNPMSQSEQYADPAYLRYWLPELVDVDDRYIHTPWEAPQPPRAYPKPIVEHQFARERTLNTFKETRTKKENQS